MQLVPSSEGVTLAVHDLGGSGERVLYSHATGFHGHCWAPMATELADRRGAVALDYRAHGHSTVPTNGDLHWHGYGDDAVAVAHALDLRESLAVGHSMGGAALLMAELRRPGTFRALVLFEPIVFEVPPEPRPRPNLADGARRRRAEFASRDEAYENYSSKPPLNVFRPDALRAYVDWGFVETDHGTVRLRCEPEHEAQTYEGSAGHDTFDRLADVRCPVLVVCGHIEEEGASRFAPHVAEGLPHGELLQLDQLNHFGPMQDPALVAKVADEFFDGVG
jgi:pimeloyl-ACP methyl ester carboxylesterase